MRLANTPLKDKESARNKHVFACNFAPKVSLTDSDCRIYRRLTSCTSRSRRCRSSAVGTCTLRSRSPARSPGSPYCNQQQTSGALQTSPPAPVARTKDATLVSARVDTTQPTRRRSGVAAAVATCRRRHIRKI